MHLGRKAESIVAPDTPRPFPLKLASVIEASIVTGWLFASSLLKVNAVNATLFRYWELLGSGKARI